VDGVLWWLGLHQDDEGAAGSAQKEQTVVGSLVESRCRSGIQRLGNSEGVLKGARTVPPR
jgi:hypothetical protein